RHTRSKRDWSSDVCSSDLVGHTPSRHQAQSVWVRRPQRPHDGSPYSIGFLRADRQPSARSPSPFFLADRIGSTNLFRKNSWRICLLLVRTEEESADPSAPSAVT